MDIKHLLTTAAAVLIGVYAYSWIGPKLPQPKPA